jgi:hypothetical protein
VSKVLAGAVKGQPADVRQRRGFVENAWRCIEDFTPDGKKLVHRDRSISDTALKETIGTIVKGVVALAVIASVVILTLKAHPIVWGPASLGAGGFLKWFSKWLGL